MGRATNPLCMAHEVEAEHRRIWGSGSHTWQRSSTPHGRGYSTHPSIGGQPAEVPTSAQWTTATWAWVNTLRAQARSIGHVGWSHVSWAESCLMRWYRGYAHMSHSQDYVGIAALPPHGVQQLVRDATARFRQHMHIPKFGFVFMRLKRDDRFFSTANLQRVALFHNRQRDRTLMLNISVHLSPVCGHGLAHETCECHPTLAFKRSFAHRHLCVTVCDS